MEIERDSGRFCKVPYMQRPYVKIERDLECFFNALYKRGHVVERHPDGTTASIPLLWVPTDGGDRCSIPFADLTADQTDKVNILLKRIGSRLSNVIVAGKPCAWCRIVRDENKHRLPWLHFENKKAKDHIFGEVLKQAAFTFELVGYHNVRVHTEAGRMWLEVSPPNEN